MNLLDSMNNVVRKLEDIFRDILNMYRVMCEKLRKLALTIIQVTGIKKLYHISRYNKRKRIRKKYNKKIQLLINGYW